MIELYSASWCNACVAVKSQLDSMGLQYKVVDVDSTEGMLKAKDMGVRGLPFLYAINAAGSEWKASGPQCAAGIRKFLNE